MPVKAGQIDIEIRAAATRLRSYMDANVKISDGGREAGREVSNGREGAAFAVLRVAKVATEGALVLAGGHAVLNCHVARYSSMASSDLGPKAMLRRHEAALAATIANQREAFAKCVSELGEARIQPVLA